jgi:hypothetical protein
LVQCDTLLAEIVPRYTRALLVLEGMLPGLSGAPAGGGSPGGGKGGRMMMVIAPDADEVAEGGPCPVSVPTSVVERAALAGGAPERRRFDRLSVLPFEIDEVVRVAADWTVYGLPTVSASASGVQRLAWARVALRTAVTVRARVGERRAVRIHGMVCELHDLVESATADPSKPARRVVELAADPTERWCTSCLRTGAREPRVDRYATDGLCRWCGDFLAGQGWLPTLALLDARQSGRRITEAMVLAERPKVKRKRRK